MITGIYIRPKCLISGSSRQVVTGCFLLAYCEAWTTWLLLELLYYYFFYILTNLIIIKKKKFEKPQCTRNSNYFIIHWLGLNSRNISLSAQMIFQLWIQIQLLQIQLIWLDMNFTGQKERKFYNMLSCVFTIPSTKGDVSCSMYYWSKMYFS